MTTPQLLPNANAALVAGAAFAGLFILSVMVFIDPYPPKRQSMPTIPDSVALAAQELQASYEDAVFKAGTAQQKETEAVQARAAAEDAKGVAGNANLALEAKRDAYLAVLASFYQPPKIPPSASPPQG